MNARRFFLIVATLYALAFGVLSTRAATTNDYTYTGPGLTGLNELLPLPTEWMSDSGAQAIRQIKAALLNFATNAVTGQHYQDGGHKTNFITSAMIGTNALERRHFGSNVTYQLLASNGVAQLPLSDVVIQWAWWTNASTTSSTWAVNWPVKFSNGIWFATSSAYTGDTNFAWFYGSPPATWSSNEWVTAQPAGWTTSNAWGTLNVSGVFSTGSSNRVCVMGVGRR